MKLYDVLTESESDFTELPPEAEPTSDQGRLERLNHRLKLLSHRAEVLQRRLRVLEQKIWKVGSYDGANLPKELQNSPAWHALHDKAVAAGNACSDLSSKVRRLEAKLRTEELRKQRQDSISVAQQAGASSPNTAGIVLSNAKGEPIIALPNPTAKNKNEAFVGDPNTFHWKKVGRAAKYFTELQPILARNGFKFTKMFAARKLNTEFVFVIVDATQTIAFCNYGYDADGRIHVGSPRIFKGMNEYTIGRFLGDGQASQDLFLTTGKKRRKI